VDVVAEPVQQLEAVRLRIDRLELESLRVRLVEAAFADRVLVHPAALPFPRQRPEGPEIAERDEIHVGALGEDVPERHTASIGSIGLGTFGPAGAAGNRTGSQQAEGRGPLLHRTGGARDEHHEQRAPGGQLHGQSPRQELEAEARVGQRLTVEVDLEALLSLDLEPGHACADERAADSFESVTQQDPQGLRDLLLWKLWQEADVEQAVIEHGLRTQLVTSTRLASVPDGEDEESPFPREAGAKGSSGIPHARARSLAVPSGRTARLGEALDAADPSIRPATTALTVPSPPPATTIS